MTRKQYQDMAFAQMQRAKYYEERYNAMSKEERDEVSTGGRTNGSYLIQLHEQALNMEAYYTRLANV